jgi:bifunctional DNase/RNase
MRSASGSTGFNPNSTHAGYAMTEMRVVQVCTCQKTDRPIVLLEDAGRSRWMSFYLPADEANRLARVLKGRPCLPVFDLLGQVATAGGLEVVGAEIDGDERVFKLGCHPADALALALRVAVQRWLDQLRPTDFEDHGPGAE